MADQAARNLQFEYKVNSNLVARVKINGRAGLKVERCSVSIQGHKKILI